MKRLLYILILLLASSAAGAQKLSSLEYFFDTDPGSGKAKSITFTAADTIKSTFSLSAAGLSQGPHILYVRFRNENRQWGPWTSNLISVDKYFDLPGLKSMEYFFDNDPGTNKAVAINAPGAQSVVTTQSFIAKGLKEGTHVLNLRYRDSAGQYGPVTTWLVNITTHASAMPQISGAEYFFDTDPGTNKATQFLVSRSDDITTTQSFAVGNLPEGLHVLYVRFKDTSGHYGPVSSGLIHVTAFSANMPSIAGAEYFIDTDPGVGKGHAITISPQADTVKKTLALAVPSGLTTGKKHYLHLRVKDAKNTWSLVRVDSFTVTAAAAASLHLIALQNDKKIMLNWRPEVVDESVTYEIERGSNSITFRPLQSSNVKNRQQLTQGIDELPSEGVNYYRIKQIDANGNLTYSNIEAVWVNKKADNRIHLYPNPATSYVTVTRNASAHEKTVWLNITDLKGHTLIKENVTNKSIQTLQIGALPKGMYLVSVVDGMKVITEKLAVQ